MAHQGQKAQHAVHMHACLQARWPQPLPALSSAPKTGEGLPVTTTATGRCKDGRQQEQNVLRMRQRLVAQAARVAALELLPSARAPSWQRDAPHPPCVPEQPGQAPACPPHPCPWPTGPAFGSCRVRGSGCTGSWGCQPCSAGQGAGWERQQRLGAVGQGDEPRGHCSCPAPSTLQRMLLLNADAGVGNAQTVEFAQHAQQKEMQLNRGGRRRRLRRLYPCGTRSAPCRPLNTAPRKACLP